MKLFPDWVSPPSESTVEQLANALILRELEPRPAWFFVPTRREEANRAYDASLQGLKSCVIQYKRVAVLKRAKRVTVRLNSDQHLNLLDWYPRHSNPHVFIGLAEYWTYAELGQDVASGGTRSLVHRIQFVNAHDIPRGSRQVDVSRAHATAPAIAQPRSGKNDTGPPVPCVSLPALVRSLVRCSSGIAVQEHIDLTGVSETPLPRVSVLFMAAA